MASSIALGLQYRAEMVANALQFPLGRGAVGYLDLQVSICGSQPARVLTQHRVDASEVEVECPNQYRGDRQANLRTDCHHLEEGRLFGSQISQEHHLADVLPGSVQQFEGTDRIVSPGDACLEPKQAATVPTTCRRPTQGIGRPWEGVTYYHFRGQPVPIRIAPQQQHPLGPRGLIKQLLLDQDAELDTKRLVEMLGNMLDLLTHFDVTDESPVVVPRAHNTEGERAQRPEFDAPGDLARPFGLFGGEPVYLVAVARGLVNAKETDSLGIEKIEVRDLVLPAHPVEKRFGPLVQSLRIAVQHIGPQFGVPGDRLQCGDYCAGLSLQFGLESGGYGIANYPAPLFLLTLVVRIRRPPEPAEHRHECYRQRNQYANANTTGPSYL